MNRPKNPRSWTDGSLYFGVELNDQSLIPGDNSRIGATRFEDWLSQSTRQN